MNQKTLKRKAIRQIYLFTCGGVFLVVKDVFSCTLSFFSCIYLYPATGIMEHEQCDMYISVITGKM